MEDAQQKIAALLKVDIITVTESAKSKEHPRGKRNGIFFSSDWVEKRNCLATRYVFLLLYGEILSLFFVIKISVSGMPAGIFQCRRNFLK